MTTFLNTLTGRRYRRQACSNCRHSEPRVVEERLDAGVKSCERNTRGLGDNPFETPCGGWEQER